MPAAKPTRRVLLTAVLAAAVLVGVWVLRRAAAPPALRPTQFVQEAGALNSVQYSREGRVLLEHGYGAGGLVVVRDAATGALLGQWRGGADGEMWLAPDGTHLVCSQYDPKTKTTHNSLRDTRTGRVLRAWTGSVVDVSRDLSQMLLMDDGNGVMPVPRRALRLVDMATGRVLGQFTPPLNTWSGNARILNSGRFLAISSFDRPALLLRLPAFAPVLPLPPLESVRVSRDNKTVIGMDKGGTLHLWDIRTRRETRTPTGLSRGRWASPGPDSTLLVGGDVESPNTSRPFVQVWSADGTHLLRTLDGWPGAWSEDDARLALPVGEDGGHAQDYVDPAAEDVFNMQTGTRLLRLDVKSDPLGNPGSRINDSPVSLAIAPDGRHFAFANPDGLLRLYDTTGPAAKPGPMSTDTGRTLLSFDGTTGYGAPIFDALVLPDGGVAASGGYDTTRRVQIWQPNGSVQTFKAVVGNGNVERLGLSPDGQTLVGVSQWGLWILTRATGQSLQTQPTTNAQGETVYEGFDDNQVGKPVWMDGPQGPISVVSTSMFGDGPVTLTQWDAAGRKLSSRVAVPREQTRGGRDLLLAAALPSPDGKTLCVLWNGVKHGKDEHGKPVNEIIGSAVAELRDTRTGRVLRPLRSAAPLFYYGFSSALAWSADGKTIAVSEGASGIVLLWDAETGQQSGRITGTLGASEPYGGGISGACVAFAPDGQTLAVSRTDGTIYLYSLRTLLPIAQIGQTPPPGGGFKTAPLRWLAFAPDGRTLFGIAQNDGAVRSWPMPLPERGSKTVETFL